MILARWWSTVRLLIFNTAPISLLLLPSASNCTTSRSRTLSRSADRVGPLFLLAFAQVFQNHSRRSRGEEHLVVQQGVDRGNEVPLRVRLEYVAAGSCLERLLDKRFGSVHGQHQDPHFRICLENLRGRIQAIQLGHANVEDHDLRTKRSGFLNGFPSVTGLTHYLPIRLRFQKSAQAPTHDRVIVRDQNRNCLHAAPSCAG